MLTFEV